MVSEPQFVIAWVVILGVAAAVMLNLQPRGDFSIHLRPGRIDVRGSLPGPNVAAITQFFTDDMPLDRSTRLVCRWRANRTLEIKFCGGKLSPFERQRIRNFLNVTLRPG